MFLCCASVCLCVCGVISAVFVEHQCNESEVLNDSAYHLLIDRWMDGWISRLIDRVPTPPGKSWILFLKIPGPGKSWKITVVLESPGNQS